jgi:hypothetical protein
MVLYPADSAVTSLARCPKLMDHVQLERPDKAQS